jgi:hypothetical protein
MQQLDILPYYEITHSLLVLFILSNCSHTRSLRSEMKHCAVWLLLEIFLAICASYWQVFFLVVLSEWCRSASVHPGVATTICWCSTISFSYQYMGRYTLVSLCSLHLVYSQVSSTLSCRFSFVSHLLYVMIHEDRSRWDMTLCCWVSSSWYSSAPVSAGNMFQDLLRLCETADNTERYI